MMTRKYYFYLDFLRALAIFLVILIHVSAPYVTAYGEIPFSHWLSGNFFDSFSQIGVPLFLMVSGFLTLTNYPEKNVKIFIKKRFLKVFIPFLIWSLFYFLWRGFFHDEELNSLSGIRNFITTKTYYHLGFFYYLLSLYIATPFIYQLVKNRALVTPLLLLWFIFISVNELLRPLKLYSRMGSELFTPYLGIYIGGYALGNNILSWVKKISTKVWFLMFLASNLIVFLGTTFLILATGNFISTLYIYYGPFVLFSSIAVFSMFKNIDVSWFNAKYQTITKFIKEISSASFGIYLIHPVIIEILYRYVINSSPPIVSPLPLIFIPVFSVLVFSVSYAAISAFKKLPLSRYIVP